MKPLNRSFVTPLCLIAVATVTRLGAHAAGLQFVHDVVNYGLVPPVYTPPSELGSFQIVINPLSGLSGNPAALAAFDRAADQWKAYISDSVTVNIDGDMQDLGNPNIIGSTSVALYYTTDYATLRTAMIADEGAESRVNAIVASLPAAGSLSFYIPSGGYSIAGISASRANWLALGYSVPAGSDATITFNSTFSFDYDNSDGISPGTMDFETVAAHEIGHALGFSSDVDRADYYMFAGTPGALIPRTLDLYRFRSAANNPASAADFSTFSRSIEPGVAANTDQIFVTYGPAEVSMATGVYNGDGRQASHWKDNLALGLMDPTLAYQEAVAISGNDLVAMDLIGWNAIPEPRDYALVFGLVSLGAGLWLRKRQQA